MGAKKKITEGAVTLKGIKQVVPFLYDALIPKLKEACDAGKSESELIEIIQGVYEHWGVDTARDIIADYKSNYYNVEPKKEKTSDEIEKEAKSLKVKDWYKEEFPEDDMGNEINPNITFYDVFEGLDNYKDIYEILNVADSVVRERVFFKLDEILDVGDGYCYEQWMSYPDNLEESKEDEPTYCVSWKVINKNDGYNLETQCGFKTRKEAEDFVSNLKRIPISKGGPVPPIDIIEENKKLTEELTGSQDNYINGFISTYNRIIKYLDIMNYDLDLMTTEDYDFNKAQTEQLKRILDANRDISNKVSHQIKVLKDLGNIQDFEEGKKVESYTQASDVGCFRRNIIGEPMEDIDEEEHDKQFLDGVGAAKVLNESKDDKYKELEDKMAEDIYDWFKTNYNIYLDDINYNGYNEAFIDECLEEYYSDTVIDFMMENGVDLIWDYELDPNIQYGIKINVWED